MSHRSPPKFLGISPSPTFKKPATDDFSAWRMGCYGISDTDRTVSTVVEILYISQSQPFAVETLQCAFDFQLSSCQSISWADCVLLPTDHCLDSPPNSQTESKIVWTRKLANPFYASGGHLDFAVLLTYYISLSLAKREWQAYPNSQMNAFGLQNLFE